MMRNPDEIRDDGCTHIASQSIGPEACVGAQRSFVERVYEFLERYTSGPADEAEFP